MECFDFHASPCIDFSSTASWIFLLIAMIITVGAVVLVGLEEQGCFKHYGDVYREYMDRTPRWIGLPRSER